MSSDPKSSFPSYIAERMLICVNVDAHMVYSTLAHAPYVFFFSFLIDQICFLLPPPPPIQYTLWKYHWERAQSEKYRSLNFIALSFLSCLYHLVRIMQYSHIHVSHWWVVALYIQMMFKCEINKKKCNRLKV